MSPKGNAKKTSLTWFLVGVFSFTSGVIYPLLFGVEGQTKIFAAAAIIFSLAWVIERYGKD